MSGGKVVAALWRARKKTGGFMYFDHEPTHLADREPLVLQSDLAAAIAQRDLAIKQLESSDRVLSETGEQLKAAIARAEALRAAGRRVTDAFRAHGKAKGLVADARTEHECIAAMVAFDEAIAAQQAEGEAS